MADANNIIVKVEVKAEDLVEACIKALVEDGTLVEVVRCKDCIYFHDHETNNTCGHSNGLITPETDDFCSYGERREP